ncbi:MAG TPA: hypothetical protein VMW27_25850 [Thermoanaerobaculia bacterium]|nr:hypothetical protein [Thermoanaerobaculia bacterium]
MNKSKLDTAANIAIILVCIVAAAVLIRNNFFPPQAAAPPGMAQAEKGDQLPVLKAALPQGSDRTLFVMLQPQCHFCNDSMPFYKRLLDERNQKGSQVKVVAAVGRAEAQAEEQQKLAAAGVQPDHVTTVDFSAAKVPGTPFLVLVDNQGKVLDAWVGKLDEDKEQEVLERL